MVTLTPSTYPLTQPLLPTPALEKIILNVCWTYGFYLNSLMKYLKMNTGGKTSKITHRRIVQWVCQEKMKAPSLLPCFVRIFVYSTSID